jgi:hypothetical protein
MYFSLQKKQKIGLKIPREVFSWQLAILAIVASGGAVMFGFELSFISGVFSLPAFLKRFSLNTVTAGHLQTNVVAVCMFILISSRVLIIQLT